MVCDSERESAYTRVLPSGKVLDVYPQLFNTKLTLSDSIDSLGWTDGW